MAEELFWSSSEVKGFNFDDDEFSENQFFGIPLKGATRLSQQLSDGLKLDSEVNLDSLSGQHNCLKGSVKYDLLQLISEKSLNAILEADSFELRVVDKSSLKPDEELRLLRRQVKYRWDTPEPDIVIKNIIIGQPYSLELFQSLKQKKALLNSAVQFGDGNAILEVVVFLASTLKKSLFQQLMFNNPVALSHYVHYLSLRMQIQEVTDLLELVGQHKEAAIKQYILASTNPQRHLLRLKNLGSKYFYDSKDKVFVDNFARLVEYQTEIKEKVGMSVVATLSCLCEKHWQDSTVSPYALSKEHCLSDKQFQWTVLTARAMQQDWDSIHSMFITKGWLRSKKVNSAIPLNDVVMQLHKFKAPSKILCTYLELIEDVNLKLSLAKKLQCHRIIIDNFANLRDKQALISYLSHLSPQTEDYIYANGVLSSAIKWKN